MTTGAANVRRGRILVGHAFWGRGGADIVATHLIAALVDRHEVHLVTRGGWDLEELNRLSGTSLRAEQVVVHGPPYRDSHAFGMVGLSLFYRHCRRFAAGYDLCVTASRVIDWGRPAIHFLSDVAWNAELQREFRSDEFDARRGLLRSAYWGLSRLIQGSSGRSPAEFDTFIANSSWTALHSAPYCRRPIEIVNPPIRVTVTGVPWADRENAVALVGRISPEKRIEIAIEIVERVRTRARMPGLRLKLIGSFDATEYAARIRRLAGTKPWIDILEGTFGESKDRVIGACKYGLSACDSEAFGMATAETVELGAIPFVPSSGAQGLLVGSSCLVYDSIEDAVEKMTSVIGSEALQAQTLRVLKTLSGRYSTEAFADRIRSIVARELAAGEST